MHTTRPSPESSLLIIHNSDYSGDVTLIIARHGGAEGATEVILDGPDFQELCETVATDTIMDKIEKALER